MRALVLLTAAFFLGCGQNNSPKPNPYEKDPSAAGAPFLVRGNVCQIDDTETRTQDGRDCACVNSNVDRAFHQLSVSGVVDYRQMQAAVSASRAWLFYADAEEGPRFSSQAETDPEWARFVNYSAGQIELETFAQGYVHGLFHQYDVTANGLTPEESAAHPGWEAKGYALESALWRDAVSPVVGVQCMP